MLFDAQQKYLDAKERYESFRNGYMPYLDNKKEYEAELERLIVASIKDQMVADVPVGAFLSGGFDSAEYHGG